MLTIAYSGKSQKSSDKIAFAVAESDASDGVCLVRDSYQPADVNWGRYKANAKLNPDISNTTNKRRMRQLFQEHDVPTPKLHTISEAIQAIASGDVERLVGRPDQHMKGRGLWKCYSEQAVRRATQGTHKKKAATHFMEYIESDREYRVHIFKGKSIRISQKVFNADGTYTTGKPGDIKLRRVRNAAKAAVDAVGLDFGAVDILARGENNEEVFVLEVNAAPGLGGTMPKLYADTFMTWKQDDA